MSDQTTSGSAPSEDPAETAGAPAAPVADWGAASGTSRGSGLARGKRVSPPASPAPVSNNTANSETYKPSAVQVIKTETAYQNPFAPVNEAPSAPAPEVAPAPVAEAPVPPVVVPPAEAPAPAPVAPAATVVKPAAPAPKAELNILPPAEVKHPSQSWETPAFPYEGAAPAPKSVQPASANSASPLRSERPTFRPERRSEVPMLEPAPNAGGNSPRGDFRGQGRQSRGGGRDGNRPQQQRGGRPQDQRGGQPQQPRDRNRPSPKASASGNAQNQAGAPASGGQQIKKPGGLFGWVKGLFGTAPEIGKPALPGAQSQPAQGGGERGPDGNRRRRRRGGRGRSGGGQGGIQNGANGPQAGNPAQSHGQGHPSHGHGGGEHRPQGQGGGRRRGGRGRSGGGQGGPQGGHRHDGGGSGIPPGA